MTIEIEGVDVSINDEEWRELLGTIAGRIFDGLCIDDYDDDMLIDFIKYGYLEDELENAIEKSMQCERIKKVCDPSYWKDEINRLKKYYE